MKVQLYIDPENRLSKVPYQVPNNTHYVRYQDYLDAQTQPDALTAYLYAAELAKDDIKKLKAEVERLTERLNRHLEINDELDARCTRLRKAGDAMASCIQFNEEMEQDYNGPTIVRQCVKDWNAAKEGKQP
jgi:hypothetical protein